MQPRVKIRSVKCTGMEQVRRKDRVVLCFRPFSLVLGANNERNRLPENSTVAVTRSCVMNLTSGSGFLANAAKAKDSTPNRALYQFVSNLRSPVIAGHPGFSSSLRNLSIRVSNLMPAVKGGSGVLFLLLFSCDFRKFRNSNFE
jgi:hypothetical protein